MRKGILICVVIIMVVLCGCKDTGTDKNSKKVVAGVINDKENTSIYDTLTEEQKKYLSDVLKLSKDWVDMMEYEAINWELLGTGFELYNQTSGAEVFGISYKEEQTINEISDSNKIITFEEAKLLRKKEKSLKLNDFKDYKYEILVNEYSDADNSFIMKMPLADYDNSYVEIVYTRDNEVINMKVPHIHYENGNTDWVFSILYDEGAMRAFFEEEPKNSGYDKAYMEVQYSSVTDNSLVMDITNGLDKKFILSESYELYELTSDGAHLISSAKGKDTEIKAMTSSIRKVEFDDDVKLVEGKKYLIKYGKNETGYIYDEVEFEK